MLNAQTDTGDRSNLGAYLHDLRGARVMSREDEHAIATQLRATGDPRLAERLVTANLRLVVKIAKEHRAEGGSLADLIQEGNVGLVQAVRKYDPSRGVKLSTYASWWVRAYILNYVMFNHRMVRLGTTQAQRKLFFNLRKKREQLERQGVEVEPKQLAAELDVGERDVVEMESRLAAGDESLDASPSGERVRPTREVVAAPTVRPDVDVEAREFKAVLADKLKKFGQSLQGRDRDIFQDRLVSEHPVLLTELAERFSVSRERVRQLEDRLKRRLRDYLEDELGDADEIGGGYDA